MHHTPVYSCASPSATSTLISNNLFNSANSLGAAAPSSLSAAYSTTSCLSSIQQSAHHHHHHHHHHHQHHPTSSVQTQLHPAGLTVTLITTIPNNVTSAAGSLNSNTNNSTTSTSTILTPLIPIIQQQQQQQQQIPSPSMAPVISTATSLLPQQPSTSAVSSSSSSPISSAQNLSSTTRDWFTFVYRIENIEDLIKNHESQQNFVQSPIFSFTNHIINTSASGASAGSHHSPMQSNSAAQMNQAGGSGGLGVPINATYLNNSSSASTSSASSTNLLDLNNNSLSQQNGIANSSNKQPSNWRLIFYPNGAGADCKNFLSVFLKYLSDEPVKIQMMFSIVDNANEDVYVKYTVNKFSKSNDWGFKQLIHKNAILYQKEKFLKPYNGGTLNVRVKMRLDEQKHDYIKKLNDNLHYCKLLSENFSQYYYNNNVLNNLNEQSGEAAGGGGGLSNQAANNCLASSSVSGLSSSAGASSSSLATSSSMAATSSSCSPSSSSLPPCANLKQSFSSNHLSNTPTSGHCNSSNNMSLILNCGTGGGMSGSNSSANVNNCHNSAGTSVTGGSTLSNSAPNSSYYDILLIVKSAQHELTTNTSNLVCHNCKWITLI